MRKLIILTAVLISLISRGQDVGFEFAGCFSTGEEVSPTYKLGAVRTTDYTYLSLGLNIPHERHYVYDVSNGVYLGLYTRLGLGCPIVDWLFVYPHVVYSTPFLDMNGNRCVYKDELYFGIAVKVTDLSENVSMLVNVDKRNIGLGITFGL